MFLEKAKAVVGEKSEGDRCDKDLKNDELVTRRHSHTRCCEPGKSTIADTASAGGNPL